MATKKADGSSLQDYKKIKELIDVTNKDLRGRGHKASLEIFRESIYIRGTFPPKGRTKINSGVKASIKGVSIAETRLMDLLVAIKTSGSIIGTISASCTNAAYLAKACALDFID